MSEYNAGKAAMCESPEDRAPGALAAKPPWLRRRLLGSEAMPRIEQMLRGLDLHTVCESAKCPNTGECFERGTATFLIMGGVCTRNCRFCNVSVGRPGPLDPQEPTHVADAVAQMGLRLVVVTSVTRDDLPDGGAGHFVATIREIRARTPEATVEVLVPDFMGDREALNLVLEEAPEVFNHNVETVPRLYPVVRPQALFERSIAALRQASRVGRSLVKTGFMVGLGETDGEVERLLAHLREEAEVTAVTIGQYLRPSKEHLAVVEYVPPETFDRYRLYGESLGLWVQAGPFVRSSYLAEEGFRRAPLTRRARQQG